MRAVRVPPRRDLLIAGALFAAVAVELATNKDATGAYPVDLVFLGSAAAVLAWRRVAPVTVTVACWALLLGGALIGTSPTVLGSALLFIALPAYALGHQTDDRRTWVALAYSLGMLVALVSHTDPFTLSDYGPPIGLLLVAFVCGRLLRNRMLLTRALADEAARLELDRELRAQAAMGEERAAIAREMHDVVAHTMAIMVVQAGAARRVLDHDRTAAEHALVTVEDTGRVALAELRRLLGFLGDQEPAALAPQPSLEDLGALIQRARDAGVPVELSVTGDPHELPAGAELAGYRIVQEALTNTLRHAGAGARATVRVRWSDEGLDLEIRDRGGLRSDSRPGGGNGIIGMRERVALYGGRLDAGPSDGGWRVRATLPCARPAAVMA